MGIKLSKKDKLSLVEAELLSDRVRLDSNEVLRWHKVFQKEWPDGKLSQLDFHQLYSIFTKESRPELCDHIFRALDTKKCGHINFEQFLEALSAKTDNEKKMEFLFRLFDVSNDGFIDLQELTTVTAALSIDLKKQKNDESGNDEESQLERIFAQMDLNGDNSVDSNEFKHWWLNQSHSVDLT